MGKRSNLVPSSKFNVKNTGFITKARRVALFFIIGVIAFGVFEPGAYRALAVSNAKLPPAKVAVAPLQNAPLSKDTLLDAATQGSLKQPERKVDRSKRKEEESKRTAFTNTYVNADGTHTLEIAKKQINYKSNGKWQKIDNTMQTAADAGLPTNSGVDFAGKSGNVKSKMKRFQKGIEVSAGGKTFTVIPVNANNVKPEKKDASTVVYRDAWKGVDVEYETTGEQIKETIYIKDKSVAPTFEFTIKGATLVENTSTPGTYSIEGTDSAYKFGLLNLILKSSGQVDATPLRHELTPNNSLKISVDKTWLNSLGSNEFPIAIDPTFGRLDQNGTDWMFKSDGYSCQGNTCYMNTGSLYNNGWKSWRSYVQLPYPELAGKTIIYANIHATYAGIAGNYTGPRYFGFGHANCIGWNCLGTWLGGYATAGDYDVNVTNHLQQNINNGDYYAVWSMWGEEGAYHTYKSYKNLYLYVDYDTPTPMAQPVELADKQVIVHTQPSFKVGTVSDGDGDAVKYYFRVSTSPDAETGAVINSGWINSPQWTVPDGILQDGTTYYWHTYTLGRLQTNPNWVRSFKVDLRTGKDSTQSYDAVGPIGVDLATGNATTSVGTHSMSALGGSIGLNLSYDSPAKSQVGLTGQYWNVPAGYNAGALGAPTSPASLTRNDDNVSFDWSTGSPGGSIGVDNFYAQWTGYFTAPATGNYQLGAAVDDYIKIEVDGNTAYVRGCCTASSSTVDYTNSQVLSLSAGQVVRLKVGYLENSGNAYARIYVKGAVPEQLLSRDWLRTDVKAAKSQYGLTGRYYTDDGSHNFPTNNEDPMRFMMQRNDSQISFNWGLGSAAPGLQTDNFMVKWTGYLTVPTSGSYTLGAISDNGVRVKLNNGIGGTENTIVNSWANTWGTYMASPMSLTGGQAIPITIEYFEQDGGANVQFVVIDAEGKTVPVPSTWLTPKASALPDGWQLGVDVDGNVGYERLRNAGSSVILEDSTRSTHEYTWTGSGYKPPVNEDGVLTKNTDNTYTLVDTDGRTYIFGADGKLKSVTSPTDDKQPAAIKYEYGGDPSRLLRITDGVTATRYGTLHYKSVNEDGNCTAPAGFDAAPDGMLCAFKTSDGDLTKLYYKDGYLARVELPGNQITDYGYDSYSRIVTTRDSGVNDVVAAGLRSAGDVITDVSYDDIGRVRSVTAPSATPNASRLEHTLKYTSSEIVKLYRHHIYDNNSHSHFSTTAPRVVGSDASDQWINILLVQKPGTHAIYQCKRPDSVWINQGWNINRYFTSSRSDCYGGNTVVGIIGYLYDTPTAQATVPLSRIRNNSSSYTVDYPALNLSGCTTEEVLGYGYSPEISNGSTQMNITDASEPLGFSKKIEYDTLLRTTKETDLTGKTTQQEWDTVKDLQLSTTDATGLKSTTIYDADDRPVESYGPAPNSWFGADRKPVTAQVANVPKTSTAYDENIAGLATSWHSVSPNGTLLDAKAYTTGINAADSSWLGRDFRSATVSSTSSALSQDFGFRSTGKITFPSTGTYTLRLYHDDGARVFIDDTQVLGNWTNRSEGIAQVVSSGTFAAVAGKSYRISFEYIHYGTPGGLELWMAGPGITDTNAGLGTSKPTFTKPGYNLQTSTKAYDAVAGDVETKTVYKDPAYGQVDKTVLDPTGLNYESKAEYEAPGAGLLRQTSKTLPGGAKTTYLHYGREDTMDNPCTTAVEAYHQAGRPKGKTEPDPDGAGPLQGRKSETIYNESGDVVATHYNNDDWTCTEYDARGRVTTTSVPARIENGVTIAGRTITNDYAVGGNPLITATTDSSGTITVENDLLGRTVRYTDAKGNVTTNTYDQFGKLTSRTSPIGNETYEYDAYDRLTKHKLDNVTYATVTYDESSRITNVQYPAGIQLSSIGRDVLGRENSNTYTLASGQQLSDQVNRYVSGDIQNGTELGVNKSYTYDKAGRLTGATIGDNTFAYEFANQGAGCSVVSGYDAGKDGNRTKSTVNGQSTDYCYNSADQLVSSSDPKLTDVTYDSHGNTVSLGDATHQTTFTYDSSDRNTKLAGGTKVTEFARDVQGRIVSREVRDNSATTSLSNYGFTGAGDTPDFVKNANGDIVQKYLTLPGDVLVTLNPTKTSAGMTTYSLPNLHGDIFATVNADGALNSTFMTGPFGEVLQNAISQLASAVAPSATPGNTVDGTTYNYVGQHQKLTDLETSGIVGGITQMGARVYIAGLGRFLQVDPVEGGTDNNYVYANNSVNEWDLTGLSKGGKQPRSTNKNTPSQAEKDAASKRNRGLPYNKKDVKSYDQKQKKNQKMDGDRNKQKRDNNKKGGGKSSGGSPPSVRQPNTPKNNNGSAAATVIGVVGAIAVGVWWGAKVLSPACGPALPVCAAVL